VISFIVPAYNEEKYLGATLASIHAAGKAVGEPYEIVVADDGSTDGTTAIAASAGAKVVSVAHRQISRTRNSGARAASGDRFIFVDADTTIDHEVVRAALDAMAAGAVGGGAAVRFETAPRWAHVLMKLFVPMFRILKWAAGCFVFCTREGFEKTGGFDETYFAGEEIIFSMALKRHGRFVIVRPMVTTSARKTEHRTGWQMLWLCLEVLVRSPFGIKQRSHADFWYDGKR
jgi:glycosyltransferase involved in cell wall biosynthesis